MAGTLYPVDKRFLLADKNEFGSVRRASVLGLVLSPGVEVLMDDGTYRLYAGDFAREKIVDIDTQTNVLGQAFPVGLDVKGVGYLYLSQMGMSAEEQEALFNAWRNLPEQTKSDYTAQWIAIDKNDMGAVQTYITGLVAYLSSL